MLTSVTHPVLLVEDSPADVYVIKRAVEECGKDIWCWTVNDGPEALMFLRKAPPFLHVPTPGLIILDLNLPKLSGRELLVRFRQLLTHEGTPIVVLSSSPAEREETRCLMLGATAYVQKAMDYDAYVGSVKTIIQRWLRGQPVPPRDTPRVSRSS
jgi:CheY-like chemotaxis protein